MRKDNEGIIGFLGCSGLVLAAALGVGLVRLVWAAGSYLMRH